VTHLNMIFVSALRDAEGHDLPALLKNAMAYNQSTSVRSILLFSAGQVMQAIDGEVAHIRSEWRRLLQCSYYHDSIVLNEEEVPGPSLTGNSLGAQRLPAAVLEGLPAEVAFFKLSEAAVAQRVRSGIARNLLQQFAADYA
jgi:Sensors of blue-light using FAD